MRDVAGARFSDGADGDGLDRARLAFQRQRLERRDLERGAGARDELGCRPDAALRRLRHQACGERGGAAEDRVRAAVRRADAAGEDAAFGEADVQRQPRARVDCGARGSQQALFVVARGRRDAGDEDDAATGGVDVALEEAHAVCVGGGLQGVDGFLDGRRRSVRALVLEHLVDPAEPHERDRGMPVLALDLLGGQMVAQRTGMHDRRSSPSTSGRPATP